MPRLPPLWPRPPGRRSSSSAPPASGTSPRSSSSVPRRSPAGSGSTTGRFPWPATWCSGWRAPSPEAAHRSPTCSLRGGRWVTSSSTPPTSTSSPSTSPWRRPAPPESSPPSRRASPMSPDAGSAMAGFRRARPSLMVGGGIALVVLVLLSWLLLRGRESTPETTRRMTVKGNTIQLPDEAPQWRYVELSVATEASPLPPPPVPGRVSFDEKRTASLSAPLPGRVERVLVRIGDRVQEGERLFNVRSAAWADLEREMASARANVEVKKRIAARARELVDIRAAPEKDALAAEADLHEAELAARASAAKRSSLRIAPEGDNLFWVVSPRSGTIVDLDVVASQEVQPSGDHPLVRISELSEVLVLADVQESDAYDLRVGGQVTIRTRAGSVTRT